MSSENKAGKDKPKYSWKELSDIRDRLMYKIREANGVDVSKLSCGLVHASSGPSLGLRLNLSLEEFAARTVDGQPVDAFTASVPKEFEGLHVDFRVHVDLRVQRSQN